MRVSYYLNSTNTWVTAGNEFSFTIHKALTVGSDRLRALVENGKRIQTEHQLCLPLDDGTLDDEHCTIRFCDGRWILHAHDTKNGTKYLCDHTMTKLEANQDLPLKEGADEPLASYSTGKLLVIPHARQCVQVWFSSLVRESRRRL